MAGYTQNRSGDEDCEYVAEQGPSKYNNYRNASKIPYFFGTDLEAFDKILRQLFWRGVVNTFWVENTESTGRIVIHTTRLCVKGISFHIKVTHELYCVFSLYHMFVL